MFQINGIGYEEEDNIWHNSPPLGLCNMSHMPQTLLVRHRYDDEDNNDNSDPNACNKEDDANVACTVQDWYNVKRG